jgi:hypothetical protein
LEGSPPSESGGSDEPFTGLTLSRLLSLAYDVGCNTLSSLEMIIIGSLLLVSGF